MCSNSYSLRHSFCSRFSFFAFCSDGSSSCFVVVAFAVKSEDGVGAVIFAHFLVNAGLGGFVANIFGGG
jgi:hypothetical protein